MTYWVSYNQREIVLRFKTRPPNSKSCAYNSLENIIFKVYTSVVFSIFSNHYHYSRTVIPPKKSSLLETLYLVAAIPHSPLSSMPGNHVSTFYHYGFAHFGHFIYMTSYNQWFWVTAFFHLAWCFQGSPMWQRISISVFLFTE